MRLQKTELPLEVSLKALKEPPMILNRKDLAWKLNLIMKSFFFH